MSKLVIHGWQVKRVGDQTHLYAHGETTWSVKGCFFDRPESGLSVDASFAGLGDAIAVVTGDEHETDAPLVIHLPAT